MKKISIQVTADGDAAARNVDRVTQSLKGMGAAGRSTVQDLDSLGQNVQLLAGSLQQIGGAFTQYITRPLMDLGRSSLESFGNLQKMQLGLAAVTGSTEQAGKQFEKLRELAKLPALGLEQVTLAALKLQNAGMDFNQTTDAITAFGNAVARAGGGRAEFERTVLAVSQIANTQFLQGDELRQLQEAGLPVIKILREEFGAFEGKELKQLGITSEQVLKTLIKRFNDMPAAQGGFLNAWENLQDTVTVALADIGSRLAPVFQPMIDWLAEKIPAAVDAAIKWFDSLTPVGKTLLGAFTAIAAAIGPVIAAIGGLVLAIGGLGIGVAGISAGVTALSGILAAAGPAIAVVAAVIVTLTAYVTAFVVAYETNFLGIRDITNDVVRSLVAGYTWLRNTLAAVWNYMAGTVMDTVRRMEGAWRDHVATATAGLRAGWDKIKTVVAAGIAFVQDLWQRHGDRIVAYYKAAWDVVLTLGKTVFTWLAGVFRMGSALISGDWQAVWDALVRNVYEASAVLTELVSKLVIAVGRYLAMILPYVYDIGSRLIVWLTKTMLKLTGYVIYILATLPIQIAKLVPSFIRAGAAIASAIWEGIKQGLREAATERLTIAVPAEQMAGAVQGASGAMQAAITAANQFGGAVQAAIPAANQFGGAVGGAGKAAKEARDPIKELADRVKQARDEFELFRDNPLARGLAEEADDYSNLNSKLREYLQLRKEIDGIGAAAPVDDTSAAGLDARIKNYQKIKSGVEEIRQATERWNEEATRPDKMTAMEQLTKWLKDPDVVRNLDAQTRAQAEQAARTYDLAQIRKHYNEVIADANAESKARYADLAGEYRLLTAVSELDKYRTELQNERTKAYQEWQKQGYTEKEITDLLKILDLREAELVKIKEKIIAERAYQDALNSVKGINENLTEELEALNRQLAGNIELTKVDIVLKEMQKLKTSELTEEQRKALEIKIQENLELARQVDAAKAAVEAQERIKEKMREWADYLADKLQMLADGDIKGFFRSIYEDLKRWLVKMAAEWLMSKFFKLLTGTDPAYGGGGGKGGKFGGIFDILRKVFNPQAGSGGGGGLSVGGGGGHGGGSIGIGGINLPTGHGDSAGPATSTGGGGGSGSSRPGAGAAAAIGAGLMVAGSMIGGRWGNTLSLAGTGLSIGFMLGGPIGGVIGAAIGAAGGLLMGILGGDPKRKRDKKEKMPQLQQGFVDSIRQLRELLNDVRSLRVSPDAALARAEEIRGAISSGFGIQFESKKYRKQAQALISGRLAEADGIITEIRLAAEIARAAGERQRRIVPEFASGVFMDRAFIAQMRDFKRRNGLLTGQMAGVDTIPSMLAAGEMVLNDRQQARVRARAGFDVFANAGIPGYANGVAVGPRTPAPSVASPGAPTIELHVEGVIFTDEAQAWLESTDGQRTFVKVYKKARRDKEING